MNKTKKPADRLIFHVDVNSAFLSWESARRMKEGLPDLRDIPACIGGDPAKKDGYRCSKVDSGEKNAVSRPASLWQWHCGNARIWLLFPVISIFMSSAPGPSRKICASYTPVMESFSIDEVFLDMTGTSLLYPDPIAAAHEIKDRISDELGFTVNVGISTNKTPGQNGVRFRKTEQSAYPVSRRNPCEDVASSGTRAFVSRQSVRKEADRGRNPHDRRSGTCMGN